MTRIATNGIELEYLWHGDTTNPVVVGVVGLSDQLIRWPVPLIDAVVQAGFSFLVFDARDMGLSTHFDDAPTPDMRQALSGEVSFDLPFSLRDMAQDTLGLMEALNITRAHLMGYSMGGAVSQLAIAARPELFASFTSIFSTSYGPGLPGRDADLNERMLACVETGLSKAEWVRRMDHFFERVDGRHFQFDETCDATPTHLAARYFDPAGMARHILAIYAHRTDPPLEQLSSVELPTLIINSDDDCLFNVEHGEDLRERIKESQLVVIEGAGHAFCSAVAPKLAEIIIPYLKANNVG